MNGFRNSYRPLVAMLATCAWLAGCNTMQRGAELAVVEPEPQKAVMVPGPPARQASEAEGLIAYFAHLRKLSGSELAREHEAARQAYGRARTDYNGVRPHSALANLTPEEFRAHHLAVAASAGNGHNFSPGLSS